MTSFRVLGPVEAWADERRLMLGGPQQVKLLAFLVLNANRALAADAVIDAVWGAERDGAPKRLQMGVSRLRKALAPLDNQDGSRLRTVSGGYLLSIAPGELDVEAFEARLRDGRRALESGDPARARDLLAQALALWRGPPLAEVAFEDYAQREIRRLQELRMSALEARIDADLQQGRHEQLIGELEALLAEDPARERLTGQLMLALYRSGRQADALQTYHRIRTQLAQELGLEPGPALKALQTQILNHDASLADGCASPDHRTGGRRGDIDEARRLPVPASSFVGRSSELAELIALLQRGETRVLTLTGPGGIGKTRLALRVAANSALEYRDGVRFVGFADVSGPELIIPAIGSAVGLPGHGMPTRVQQLSEWLQKRELLLLLDSLEHVVAGTQPLGELLALCPGLVLLVTSREPLHLAGECQYEVPVLTRADAIELFTRRAAAVARRLGMDAAIAANICDRLDDLPLAIELAAARTKVLSPADVLERLNKRLPLLTDGPRDAPERQRTLRATIDWSYELLNDEQRRLFTRLAVFAGGWTLPAAEVVSGADVDTLQALVDRSLVQTNRSRYWMLGTLREYAFERLQQSGELDDIQRLHHQWFANLLDAEADAHVDKLIENATEGQPWLPESSIRGQEVENIRAAVAWALKERRWHGWKRG